MVKLSFRTDMPMIQIPVSPAVALKFTDQLESTGWKAHRVVYPKDNNVMDIHFTDEQGNTSLDYSVIIQGDNAWIGTRPQHPGIVNG